MSEAEQWIEVRSYAPVRRIAAAWRRFGLGVLRSYAELIAAPKQSVGGLAIGGS